MRPRSPGVLSAISTTRASLHSLTPWPRSRSMSTPASQSTERHLLDLSADELGHILAYLPTADDIGWAATTSRAFKTAAQRATKARVAACPVSLPPLMEGESELMCLRWCEAVARAPKQMLAASPNSHQLSLREDGALFTWGGRRFNKPDECWVPQKMEHDAARPTSLSYYSDTAIILDVDGAVWSWAPGRAERPWLERPERLWSLAGTRILQVSTGQSLNSSVNHTLLLTEVGSVMAIGQGMALGALNPGYGKTLPPTLVPGFEDRRAVQVAAGFENCAAVCDEGGLWTWGYSGTWKTLGHGFDTRYCGQPTWVQALETEYIRSVSLGHHHTLAVTSLGEVYAWGGGCGSFGKLGLGPEPEFTEDYTKWPEGFVWIADGMFGEGPYWAIQTTPKKVKGLKGKVVRQASAGNEHSALVTDTGELYTMGQVYTGKLGHGEDDNEGYACEWVPKLVPGLAPPLSKSEINALEVSELKEKLRELGERTSLGKKELAARLLAAQSGRSPVVEVVAAREHTLARTACGKIYSCGCGFDGQLGHGEDDRFTHVLAPKEIEALTLV